MKSLYAVQLRGTLTSLGTTVAISDVIPFNGIALGAASFTDETVVFENADGSIREIAIGSASGGTLTLSKRGLEQGNTEVQNSDYKLEWRSGTTVYITGAAFDIADLSGDNTWTGLNTFTKDLTLGGVITATSGGFAISISGTSWRLRADSGDMYFRDDSTAETSLSELAAGAGTDHKVLVTASDTTANYLNSKIGISGPVTKTTTNPAGNEVLTLGHDFTNTTYYVATSSGAGDSGKVVRLNASGQLAIGFLPTYPVLKRQVLTFTRDTSQASTTQTVSHTLGVTPQLITFMGLVGNNGYTMGAYDGTNQVVSFQKSGASAQGQSTSAALAFVESTGVTSQVGVISAVSSTDFTITWTRTGSPIGIMYVTATLEAVV